MINWKVRFKNKTWLVTFVVAVIAFIYETLGVFGVVPHFSQEMVTALVLSAVDLLVLVGVVIDPTTPNIEDSERAKGYTIPGGTDEEREVK